jgi:diguanylate cyclase (GGDEF)-like protein/PAS domain S-box-containing protein
VKAVPRTGWRAGPDHSAIPNLPELHPVLAGLLFAAVAGLTVSWTVPLIGLPIFPRPVIAAAFLLGGVAQPGTQRLISGGALDRRAGLRIALALIGFSAVACGCGLPSMVPVFSITVAAVHLHWSGWRVWRLVALQSLLFTLVGETAVGLGWLPAAMSAGSERAVACLFLVTGTQTLSIMGMTTRRREETEHELRHTRARFRSLVQKSQDVIAIIDRDSRILYLSPSAARVTSHRVDDLHGRRLLDLLSAQTGVALHAAMIRTEGAGTGGTEDLEVLVGAGTEHAGWLEVTVTNLLDDPAVGGFVLNATDVTDRRRYQEQLVHAATHDPLTGLLNRSAFVTTLQRELASVAVDNQAWLFFCDLDGFKAVNDRLGHDAGDAVLVHAARRLRHQAGKGSVVGRFGGDEFCILVPPGDERGCDPHELRDLLAEAVAEPCLTPGGERVRVQGSFGLVCLDGRQLLADEVLREADQRMYARKRRAAAGLAPATNP